MKTFEFAGTHVIADIYEIDEGLIADEALLLGSVSVGIARAGATLCGMQVKHFEPCGMTAVYMLAESHVSIHTYPESRSLFFDAFTCGSCDPEIILRELVVALGGCPHHKKVMRRGVKAANRAPSVPLSCVAAGALG
jgi:S-adenosylmethionine decarboxylase